MEYPRLLDTLDEECRRAADALRPLPEEAFARPTRCPPWDVKALLAHVRRDVDRLVAYLDEEPAPEPTRDSVTYFGAADPVAEAPGISVRAVEAADGFATGGELLAAFDEDRARCIGAVRDLPAERLIATRMGTLRLDEYVKTRVLEAAVHGLDLAAAVGHEPWLTPGGADVTGAVLTGLLGVRPPHDLRWHAIDLIEKGTGRRSLTLADRDALGLLADRFPLLR